jgi:hypothetical protein
MKNVDVARFRQVIRACMGHPGENGALHISEFKYVRVQYLPPPGITSDEKLLASSDFSVQHED